MLQNKLKPVEMAVVALGVTLVGGEDEVHVANALWSHGDAGTEGDEVVLTARGGQDDRGNRRRRRTVDAYVDLRYHSRTVVGGHVEVHRSGRSVEEVQGVNESAVRRAEDAHDAVGYGAVDGVGNVLRHGAILSFVVEGFDFGKGVKAARKHVVIRYGASAKCREGG